MNPHINHRTGKPFPTGLRPTPRNVLAAATPFRKPAGTIPDHFFIFPKKLSMWLNDQYGDCVTAEEAFNKACNGIFIEDATVLAWCTANGVLNGANLQPVIQQMQASGFSQDSNIYGDGDGLAINYGDAPTLQAAIYQAAQQGGCVKAGVASAELPSGAGNANGWFLPSDSPDQNEDHCMGVCGYGTAQQFVDALNTAFSLTLTVPSGVDPTMQGYAMFTWSTIGFVSVQAFTNFVGEAWIRNPSSVNKGTGTPDPDSVYTTGGPVPPQPPTAPATLIVSTSLPAGVYQVPGGVDVSAGTLTLTNALTPGSYPVGVPPIPPSPPSPPTPPSQALIDAQAAVTTAQANLAAAQKVVTDLQSSRK